MSTVTDAEHRRPVVGAPGTPRRHDSAHLHVSGRAHYTDDLPEPRDLLHAAIGVSTKPHARIRAMNLDAVRAYPGVRAVL
ncbi:MAG: hypothetical protein AAFX58_12725, partial [Pseudomonadota bacterium]